MITQVEYCVASLGPFVMFMCSFVKNQDVIFNNTFNIDKQTSYVVKTRFFQLQLLASLSHS